MEQAIAAIKAGGLVVVMDGEDRENEGDLIMAAALVPSTLVSSRLYRLLPQCNHVVVVFFCGWDLTDRQRQRKSHSW